MHDVYKAVEYLSMFKYGYQAFTQSQFSNDSEGITFNGQQYQGDILAEGGLFYF